MSIDRWMDKDVVVHIYNAILLSHTKECIWLSSNEVDERRAYYTEWSKSEREKQIEYSAQSLSRVWLFATPWTAARQGSLSITISQSLLKLMSIESARPLNHLILCQPLLLLPSIFPSIRVFFPISQLFASDGQSVGASASALVLPMLHIQGWFPQD